MLGSARMPSDLPLLRGCGGGRLPGFLAGCPRASSCRQSCDVDMSLNWPRGAGAMTVDPRGTSRTRVRLPGSNPEFFSSDLVTLDRWLDGSEPQCPQV